MQVVLQLQRWFLLLTLFIALSCSDSLAPKSVVAKPARTPAAIVIQPPVFELLYTADSVQLQAVVLAADSTRADAQTVQWTSLDTTIATVNARGVVTLSRPTVLGQVVLTASSVVDPGIVATLRVLVGRPPEVVVLSPAAFGEPGTRNVGTLSIGETMSAHATGMVVVGGRFPEYTAVNALQHVTWISRDPSVATVDSTGRIIARAPGIARIVATSSYAPRLGDSATVTVLAAPLRFTTVSVGGQACALTETGIAYCWGGNARHLGAGMLPGHIGPVKVATSVTFRAISTGGAGGYFGAHTCALSVDDALYCWGDPGGGARDAAATSYQPVPARVTGGPAQYRAVSAGYASTCALDRDGVAYCWGSTFLGLGEGSPSGSTQSVEQPTAVLGGIRFTAISVGGGACGLSTDSTTFCWGPTPTAVPGGLHFVELSVGRNHACGRLFNGTVYCWNMSPFVSAGQGATPPLTTPKPIPGGLSFSAIYTAQSEANTCGVTTAGVYCWTYTPGTEGDGSPYVSTTPSLIPTSLRFTTLGVSSFSCGISSGKAYCWGLNVYGQLGDNTDTDRLLPVAVGGQWP